MLRDAVVWVTGASRGIGQGVALACAKEGAQTILVARNKAHLQGTADVIRAEGLLTPFLLEYDITQQAAVGRAFAEVFAQTKRLDVIVNNAGIMQDALLGMVTAEQVERTFATNVYAAIYHMQYAARLMARRRSGSIINISSIIGRVGNAGQTVYGASKAALLGATFSAAKELAPHNIRVNAVAPGFIDTDMTRQLAPDKFKRRVDLIGMGRVGTPEDVALTVLFLASDLSRYVTGQVLGADGGMLV